MGRKLALAICGLILAGCGAETSPPPQVAVAGKFTPKVLPRGNRSVILDSRGKAPPPSPSLHDAVASSDMVVEAVVMGKQMEELNPDLGRQISTVRIDRIVAGLQGPVPYNVTVGQLIERRKAIRASGAIESEGPTLVVGKRYILFLSPSKTFGIYRIHDGVRGQVLLDNGKASLPKGARPWKYPQGKQLLGQTEKNAFRLIEETLVK